MKTNFFLICLSLLFSLGCTRAPQKTSLITLSLPASGPMSSKVGEFVHTPSTVMSQSVGAYSEEDGPEWNSVINPSALADINCYMIAIAGPEADMRRNVCSTTSGQSVFVGRWNGAISGGQPLVLEVPSGRQREVIVIGFKAVNGACTNFKTSEPNSANLSEPHVIGRVIQDLPAGDVSVTVPISLSASTLKIADCTGPDFNLGEGSQMYFGNAPLGGTNYNYSVSGADDITTSPPLTPVNLRGAYGVVSALDFSDSTSTRVQLTSGSVAFNNFNTGDEVMVIVMAGNGTMGPAGNDYDSCGYRAWTGRYTFTRVKQTLTSPNRLDLEKGTFLDTLWKDAHRNGTFFEGTDLAEANTVLTNAFDNSQFCRIQIVKVPHFNHVNVLDTTQLSAPAFNYDNGGGVLAFRANQLSIGVSGAEISMSGKGFQGVSNSNGDGVRGRTTTPSNSANANGGGYGSVDMTAGGGGHGNEPQTPTYLGPFGPSGGNGVTGGGAGGHGVGEDCGRLPNESGYCFGNLSYKMFMGGAGGGNNAVTGGAGGGIIFIAAKNYTSSSSGQIMSQGLNPTGGGGGGGAGGTINFIFESNSSVDASGAHKPILSVNGGDGVVQTTNGSGGGGAGRVQTMSCTGNQYDSTAILSLGGNTGGGGGDAQLGQSSLKSIQTVNCAN